MRAFIPALVIVILASIGAWKCSNFLEVISAQEQTKREACAELCYPHVVDIENYVHLGKCVCSPSFIKTP